MINCSQLSNIFKIREYCESILRLDDDEVSQIPWDIFIRIVSENDPKILGYNGVNWQHLVMVITRRQNYMIALYNHFIQNDRRKLTYFNRNISLVFECIFEFVLRFIWSGQNGDVCPSVLSLDNTFINVSKLKRRMFFTGLVCFLSSPVIFILLLLYQIVGLIESLKTSSGVGSFLSSRDWSRNALWTFRHFDEVDKHFETRVFSAHRIATKYLHQFRSVRTNAIMKALIFSTSLFLSIIVIISLVSKGDIMEHSMWHGPWSKSIIFFSTLLISLIVMFKNIYKDEKIILKPHKYMLRILEHINLPVLPPSDKDVSEDLCWDRDAHSLRVKKEFHNIFETRLFSLLKEMTAVFIVPFTFMTLMQHECLDIIRIIQKSTDQMGPGLGTKFVASGLNYHSCVLVNIKESMSNRDDCNNFVPNDKDLECGIETVVNIDQWRSRINHSIKSFSLFYPYWSPPHIENTMENNTQQEENEENVISNNISSVSKDVYYSNFAYRPKAELVSSRSFASYTGRRNISTNHQKTNHM